MIIHKQFLSYLTQPNMRWRQMKHRQGQTLVEYALILAIISILIVGSLVQLQTTVKSVYSTINTQVARAPLGQ